MPAQKYKELDQSYGSWHKWLNRAMSQRRYNEQTQKYMCLSSCGIRLPHDYFLCEKEMTILTTNLRQ